jgi:hypothetical protein
VATFHLSRLRRLWRNDIHDAVPVKRRVRATPIGGGAIKRDRTNVVLLRRAGDRPDDPREPGEAIRIHYVNNLPERNDEECVQTPCMDMTNLHFFRAWKTQLERYVPLSMQTSGPSERKID